MRKILLISIIILGFSQLNAQIFTVNSITYDIIESNTVEVYVACDAVIDGKITIPETVQYNSSTYTVIGISGSVFNGCSLLKEITLPSTMISIGDFAFSGTALETIVIPSKVTSVGKHAFRTCKKLRSVIIPDDSELTSIDDFAFYYCTALETIAIPSGVTSIGAYALGYCTALTSITIPREVTSIGASAFSGCGGLTSVTIPDDSGLKSVGENAFYNCTALTLITIPSGVTSIDYGAFQGCTALTTVTSKIKGEDLFSIDTEVFSEDEYLPKLKLYVPEGSEDAYRTTNGWKEFYFINDLYTDSNGITYTITNQEEKKETVEVSSGCSGVANGSLNIPETVAIEGVIYSVASIGTSAFKGCSSLKEITLPNTLKSIGNGAFRDCTALASITLPSGVTSIDDLAFMGCTVLTTVTISSDSELTSIGSNAVSFCPALKTITLPDGVTSIGSFAFSRCTSLISITLPSELTIIDPGLFAYCTGLETIILPSKLTRIGEHAFNGCILLETITLPSGLTSIDKLAFVYCKGLETITLPSGLTSIGEQAFTLCEGLKTITLPSGLTSIGQEAFSLCTALTMVTSKIKGENLFSINNNVFYQIKLSSIPPLYVPEGSEDTYRATDGWKEFSFINDQFTDSNGISYTVTNQGEKTVEVSSGCSAVVNGALIIPETVVLNGVDYSVTSIGEQTFADCTLLDEITLPSTITSIGKSAFKGCTALQSVRSLIAGEDLISINTNVFSGLTLSTISLYVPEGSEATYRAADGWKEFSFINDQFIDSNGISYTVTNQGEKTVEVSSGCTAVVNGALSIPETVVIDSITYSVTSIGEQAFADCTLLEEITLPRTITSIGESAFKGCTALQTVRSLIAGEDLISINTNVFSGLTLSTISLYVPEGSEATYRTIDGWKEFSIIDNVLDVNSKTLDRNAVEIFPIPTREILYVNLKANLELVDIFIYNILGQSQTLEIDSDNKINVSQLSKGVYILHVNTNQGKIIKRLVKY